MKRIDRTAFWSGSFEEARRRASGKDLTPEERLRIALEMTYRAYGYTHDNPPRLDKTVFSKRKRP